MLDQWTVSSFCNAGACVAVRRIGDDILLTDTKMSLERESASVIRMSVDQWHAFANELLAGTDIHMNDVIQTVTNSSGTRFYSQEATLDFSHEEMQAFILGLQHGDFTFEELVANRR